MALQINGAAQVKLYYSNAGSLAINVLGAVVTGNPTFDQTLANNVGSAIKTGWQTFVGGLMGTNVSLVRVGIRDIRTANKPEFRDTGAAVSGVGTGDTLPTQTALCITIRTAQSGKSFRGRCYLPGWTEAQNGATGVALAAANTGGVSFLQSIDSALKANGMALGVLSYPSEEKIITETTNHANGTTTVRTLSHQRARTGSVAQSTSVEARTAAWETIRRRANGRGVPPALSVASAEL